MLIVCRTLENIKASTKIQTDTVILTLFCYLFGVEFMRFITKATAKEILFTCLIYDATVYH